MTAADTDRVATLEAKVARLEAALVQLTLANRGVLGRRFFLQNPELRNLIEEVKNEKIDLGMLV